MGLQRFERRLERMVEGGFARVFRGSLQPVEIGRRLQREMDLRRTMAPRGTLAPNVFVVHLSADDRARFASIEDELVEELVSVAHEHADVERYHFLGPVQVSMVTDEHLAPGMVEVAGEMVRKEEPPAAARLELSDGTVHKLGDSVATIGRLPDCAIVLNDPNVSRHHAEVRPVRGNKGALDYEIVDLGSTNGTKVNGSPVTAAQTLKPGDQITLGAANIRFERS